MIRSAFKLVLIYLWAVVGVQLAIAQTPGLYEVIPSDTGSAYTAVSEYHGEKIPLIIIHGLNNTIQTEEIKSLTDRLAGDAALIPYFQVFTFEYDTHVSIEVSGKSAAERIAGLVGGRSFVVIGHSLGGLVARTALERFGREAEGVDLLNQCLRLVTLGTPHRGTPAANEKWVADVEQRYPFLRSAREKAEATTGLTFTRASVRQMAWDDFDGRTPATAREDRSEFLNALNAALPGLSAQTSQKYVFYGGYFTRWPDLTTLVEMDPEVKENQYLILGTLLGFLFVENTEFYVGSDGLVPLTSTLLLGTAPDPSDDPVARLLNGGQSDNGFYRVVLNADAVPHRRPLVRAAEAFPDCLHHQYPVHPDVYARLKSELRLEERATGDLTGEGNVDITDAVAALRIIVGLKPSRTADLLAGDRDRSGRLTVDEAVFILRRAVGLP